MDKEITPILSPSPDDTLILRLARRVREVRKQKRMPRRVVSERSGVSPRYLAQLEAGEGNISILLLERVAHALEVPIEALIARKIFVAPEAQRIAHQYEGAPEHLRAQIKELLLKDSSMGLRRGRICLLGLRGAGKTTLGRQAADTLGLPFVELSTLIRQETGMPLAEVMSLYGAEGYRRLEADALDQIIKRPGPVLLSVSSGLVEQAMPFARLLERFHTIWLYTSASEHAARVRSQSGPETAERQTLALVEIDALMRTRAPLYARAQAHLDTTGSSPEQSLRDLVDLIQKNRFLNAPTS